MREVRVVEASLADKGLISELLEIYQHEMYVAWIDRSKEPGEDGRFGYRWLDSYWQEPDRHAFLIKVGEEVAGFGLVNGHLLLRDSPPGARAIAEFFVAKDFRRRGIGSAAAVEIFDTFPGYWEIAAGKGNAPALSFWRGVIDRYAQGPLREEETDGMVVQTFKRSL